MTVLQSFNWNSIWWIPVSIKDLLQLRNNGRCVSPEANPGCHIKVIPHEIACGNMGSNITNNILSMVDPCKIRIDVSCASSIWKFGRSCACTLIVLWRRAENIGVQEWLQVLICIADRIFPVCYQELHCCILREDYLTIITSYEYETLIHGRRRLPDNNNFVRIWNFGTWKETY